MSYRVECSGACWRLPALALAAWMAGAALLTGSGSVLSTASAHDGELTEGERQALAASGELPDRLRRMRALKMHELDPGVAQRGLFKVQRTQLEAAGVPQAEIARRLSSGPQRAFPFSANPELASKGTVRTLTILIDFKDFKAPAAPTVDDLTSNIYGHGTAIAKSFAPYESVHAYYERASNGKSDLQGSVLGWHHFTKNRDTFEPKYTPGMSDFDKSATDNRAIFKMCTGALSALDADNDFSDYDNDNDGDIDLVTVLYAGPPGTWASFWWAYRWEFWPGYTPEAATTQFDGKILNQFVFQYVNTRPGTGDFDPKTLIHEMGHAYGLADFYDYESAEDPPLLTGDGGVGGLDMMDSNWGNHNAFSRWLLDWIEPVVIGQPGQYSFELEASGKGDIDPTKPEAIAIFPGLTNASAPDGEMFIIENRHQLGNDAGTAFTPGSGCLIWHVEATPNSFGNDFLHNNSFTTPKLLRLMRRGVANDFTIDERANATTYYRDGHTFSPNSVPASHNHAGSPTGITLSVVGNPGETVKISAQLQAPSPGPTPPLVQNANPPGAAGAAPQAPTGEDVQTAESELDRLLKLNEELARATPAELTEKLTAAIAEGYGTAEQRRSIEVIASQLAAKDGKGAVDSILAVESPELRNSTFPLIMEAWMRHQPQAATAFFLDRRDDTAPPNEALPAANRGFGRLLGEYVANSQEFEMDQVLESVKSVEELSGVAEAYGKPTARLEATQPDIFIEKIHGKLRQLDPDFEQVLEFSNGTLDQLRKFRSEVDDGASIE